MLQELNQTKAWYGPQILRRIVECSKRKRLLRAIQICVTIIHVGGFIFGSYGKITFVFNALGATECIVKLVDFHKDFVTAATNIVGFYCVSNNLKLLETIYIFQSKIHCTPSKGFYNATKCFFYTLAILIVLIYFFVIFTKLGTLVFIYTMPSLIEYSVFNVTLFSMLYISQEIKEHIAGINEYLLKRVKVHLESNIISLSASLSKPATAQKFAAKDMTICLDNLRYITTHHETVCDILDTLNDKFTALSVLTIVTVTGNIVWSITMIIKNGFSNYQELEVLVILLIMIIVAVGQAALVAWVGEQTDKEGHRTIKICLCLLNKVLAGASRDHDESIVRQLIILFEQSKSRKINLHAGGFFQVNWGILGTITSTAVTYSIVVIQFYFARYFN